MDQGTAIVVGAVIAAAPALVVIVLEVRTGRVARDTHRQVLTMNEGTIGSFAAENETRRIEEIAHDERTATEQRHVDQAPEVEPPQGPQR